MFFFIVYVVFFFFKQKTAYEMRISDWSSDVCSSDLSEQQRVTLVSLRLTSVILCRTARQLAYWVKPHSAAMWCYADARNTAGASGYSESRGPPVPQRVLRRSVVIRWGRGRIHG